MKKLSLSAFVCGTIIVLAPIIHNLISMAMLTHLLATDPKGDFRLHGSLNDSYQSWCLFIGICLFVVGVVSGFKADGRAGNRQTLGTLAPAPSNG